MDGAIFGTDHAPAALGLRFSHGSQTIGQAESHPSAMRNLIEAVRRSDGPDLDRLEEKVIAMVCGHPVSTMIAATDPQGSVRMTQLVRDLP